MIAKVYTKRLCITHLRGFLFLFIIKVIINAGDKRPAKGNYMQCPTHGKELRSGKFGLYCATKQEDGSWCKYKPQQAQSNSGYQKFQEAGQAISEKASDKMSRQDWEAKEARTNKNILLQVAFKAAVELYCAMKPASVDSTTFIREHTIEQRNWLLSQIEGQKVSEQTYDAEALDFMSGGFVDGANIEL